MRIEFVKNRIQCRTQQNQLPPGGAAFQVAPTHSNEMKAAGFVLWDEPQPENDPGVPAEDEGRLKEELLRTRNQNPESTVLSRKEEICPGLSFHYKRLNNQSAQEKRHQSNTLVFQRKLIPGV